MTLEFKHLIAETAGVRYITETGCHLDLEYKYLDFILNWYFPTSSPNTGGLHEVKQCATKIINWSFKFEK